MKYLYLFLFFCFINFACELNANKSNDKVDFGKRDFIKASNEQKDNMKKSLEKYSKFVEQKKFRQVVEFNHPLVIQRLMDLNNIDETTAKDALADFMSKDVKENEKGGILMKKAEINKLSETYIEHNGTIYTSNQISTSYIVRGKPTTILETCIAISKDNGKRWYFINKSDMSKKILLTEIDEETYNLF